MAARQPESGPAVVPFAPRIGEPYRGEAEILSPRAKSGNHPGIFGRLETASGVDEATPWGEMCCRGFQESELDGGQTLEIRGLKTPFGIGATLEDAGIAARYIQNDERKALPIRRSPGHQVYPDDLDITRRMAPGVFMQAV